MKQLSNGMKIGNLTEVAAIKYSDVFRALIAVGPSNLWLPIVCNSPEEVKQLQMSARQWFALHKSDEFSIQTRRDKLTHTLYLRLTNGL